MVSANGPLNPAGNGRANGGRFGPGNKFGKGNPANRRAQALRAEYVRAVTRQDMREIVAAVLTAAKGGDISACKEVCDRILGKAPQADLLERIEQLEARFQESKS